MLRISREIRLAFFPVFAIVLAIVLSLFQAVLDFRTVSAKDVALNIVFAILISLAAAAFLLAGFFFLWGLTGKVWRRLLVRITLYTVARAVSSHARAVQAQGVGEQRGIIVIRLAIGSSESIVVGDKFEVANTATRGKLGVLEVIGVEEESCVCRVFDRMNAEFWDDLEGRMRRDPSPPPGVTFSREIPGGVLDFLSRLVRSWGG